MTQNENNPKAFPVINQGNVYETGMDLRDYFAGLAMQGHLASEYYVINGDQNSKESLAKQFYNFADAMLKQRSL